MRKKIVAGNWKMNQKKAEAIAFIQELKESDKPEAVEVIIAAPFVVLDACQQASNGKLIIAAQNVSAFDKGAYTGEISTELLKSIKVETVIIGHSERRSIFGETHDILAEKVKQAVKNNFKVIFCVGESLEEREAGKAEATVKKQLAESLFFITKEQMRDIVIAYEPVWAIGTGKTASPEQAQKIHAFIRELLKNQFDSSIASDTSILYGGSVNPKNAKELFAQADIDGGLVGGASLEVSSFVELLHSF